MGENEVKNEQKERPALPPITVHSDEIIDAVDRMSLDDLLKEGGGIKLLVAQYKEKCDENRTLQNKLSGLNITVSDLSNKLAIARERLSQIGGTGVVLNIFNLIAGALMVVASTMPNSTIRSTLFILAIGIFVVCIIYYFFNRNQQKGIEERGK